jgi:hypothetical protein
MLRKQHALWLSRDFLSRCCDSVHVPQAISQRFHHVRGEMRRLLNEKMEPTSIDFRQPAGGLRHCAGRARAVIDQCHLTNQRSWPCGLEYEISKQDFHFPFQQHVRLLAFIAFAEEGIAGRELERGGFVTKKLRRIHECNAIDNRDYKGGTITAKLRLCDNRSDAVRRANSSCPS